MGKTILPGLARLRAGGRLTVRADATTRETNGERENTESVSVILVRHRRYSTVTLVGHKWVFSTLLNA